MTEQSLGVATAKVNQSEQSRCRLGLNFYTSCKLFPHENDSRDSIFYFLYNLSRDSISIPFGYFNARFENFGQWDIRLLYGLEEQSGIPLAEILKHGQKYTLKISVIKA